MAIKAITLAPGESYVLPPGADVLSVSVPGVVTAEKGCTDLENLEELTCYIFVTVGHQKTPGGGFSTPNFPWEADKASITGININGTEYPLTANMTNSGLFDLGVVQSFMAVNTSVQGMFIAPNIQHAFGNSGPINRGGVMTLCFKTIPSVAKDIYLNVQSELPGTTTPNTGTKDWRIYAIPYAEYTGDGKCACTLE
jgi:hypothetical protein